ncbi:MAG: HU family DNA-binding protein [Alphaproteobacteria bacterium]
MNKEDLVTEVANAAGTSKTDTRSVIDAFINVVTDVLKRNDDVRLVGFGTFLATHRKESEGRNPRTGEKIKIKAAKVPKFRPGKQLKTLIN